jgi:diamine N-acetyltransferase
VLAALMERTFRDTYSATSNADAIERHVAEHFGPERQAAELADPALATLLVEVGGELAGFAQLRRGEAPPCVAARSPVELLRFYVDRPWHGRGVAAPLMDACFAAAGEADALWLLVYRINERALTFYRKHGFVAVGTHPYHFGDEVHDDIVMVRELSRTGQ